MFPPPGTNGLPRKPPTNLSPVKHDLASRLSSAPGTQDHAGGGLNIRGHAGKPSRPAESSAAPRDELHIRNSAVRDPAPSAARDPHPRLPREPSRDPRDREPREPRGEPQRRDHDRRDALPPLDRRDPLPPLDRRDPLPPLDRRDPLPPLDRRDPLPPRPSVHDGPRDRDGRNGHRSPARVYDRRDERRDDRRDDRSHDRRDERDRDRSRDREHRRGSPPKDRHPGDRYDSYAGDRGRYERYAPRDRYDDRYDDHRRDPRDYRDSRDDRRGYRDDRRYDRRDDHRRHDHRRSSPSRREDGEVHEDGEILEPAVKADPKPPSPSGEAKRRRSRSPVKHAHLPPRPATPPLPQPRHGTNKEASLHKPPTPPPKGSSSHVRPLTPPTRDSKSGRPPTPPTKEGAAARPAEPKASPPPPPPPPDDIPPPPPPGAPPPPPSDTPSGTPDAPPPAKKAYAPRPHAPNRNLAESTSTPRALTPQPSREPPTVKHFQMRSTEQEQEVYLRKFRGVTTLASYNIGDKLGEGTFGVVTQATDRKTGRKVALKKLITHNPRDGVSVTTVREIKILKELRHQNVVPILDMVVQRKRDKAQLMPGEPLCRGEVFMVFPYMDHDLCGLLLNKDFRMTHSIAKLLLRQILQGLAYMHGNNIIHRDLKTANILVGKDGGVMIADFGLARTLGTEPLPKHSKHEYTNMVVTRWYRAPELLLGDVHYGPAIDLWSMGCILGEMYLREPIFPGDSDRDQLLKIFARVEPPNQRVWPGWDKLPGFPDAKSHPWDKTHKETNLLSLARKWQMDRAGADLMVKLLTLDPSKRPTANEALDHVWFWSEPLPAKLGTMPTVESSHEMTTRERAPANRRPAQNPAWVQPPPQAHARPAHGRHGYQGQQQQQYRPQHHQHHHQQQQQQMHRPPPGYMPPAVPAMAMGGPPQGYSSMGPGPGPGNHPGNHPNSFGRGPPMGGPMNTGGGGRGPPPPFKLAGPGPGGPAGLPPNPNTHASSRVPAPGFRLAGGRPVGGPSFGNGGGPMAGKRPNQGEPRGRDKRPRTDGSLPY